MRYSPDGNFWASGGFDGKIFLYDGKDSELQCEIQEGDKNAHGGGIYALSWAGNSRQFLSCSGDKSCKIWDVETKKSTTTFTIGTTVEDQQVGCLWSGNFLLSGTQLENLCLHFFRQFLISVLPFSKVRDH